MDSQLLKFPLSKIADIASENCTRPMLSYIKIEDGFGVATDGRMLVRAKVEAPVEVKAMVPAKAIHLSQKQSKHARGNVWLNEDGSCMILGSDCVMNFPKPPADMVYPNWENVVPKDKPDFVIALNVDLLLKIAKALGNEVVSIGIYKDKENPATTDGVETTMKPFKIQNSDEWDSKKQENFGVLMPVQLARD